MIQRLEVWEKYLVGYAPRLRQLCLRPEQQAKTQPGAAFAEFEVETQVFHSYSCWNRRADTSSIMPSYDYEGDKFSVNPAFEKPCTRIRTSRKVPITMTAFGTATVMRKNGTWLLTSKPAKPLRCPPTLPHNKPKNPELAETKTDKTTFP